MVALDDVFLENDLENLLRLAVEKAVHHISARQGRVFPGCMDVAENLRSVRFDLLLGRRPQNFQEIDVRRLAQFNFLDLGRGDLAPSVERNV